MHNNPVLLERYAHRLNNLIQGSSLNSCVSTSSIDLYFLFDSGFSLNIQFAGASTFFLNLKPDHFPQKSILVQFKTLIGSKVKEVKSHFPDRSIELVFSNAKSLHILAYGRHSGLLLTINLKVVDSFRFKNPPETFSSDSQEVVHADKAEVMITENRFLTPALIDDLAQMDYFKTDNNQEEIWKMATEKWLKLPLKMCEVGATLKLSIYEQGSSCEVFDDIIKAFDVFARRFLGHLRFSELHHQVESELSKRLKHSQKMISNTQVRLAKMTSAEQFKQKADVIMANLHAIDKGIKNVDLFNFYTNSNEVIRLNKDLSPQLNAERYYRKSKNSHLEEEHQQKLAVKFKREAGVLESLLLELNDITEYRELQKFSKTVLSQDKNAKAQSPTPYKSYSMSGFEIWVGKSAQSNDELLKRKGRFDLWLHAREVAGSHVLIKNPEDLKIPEMVLEYAASLAAGHSKNQHESLAAVIYTPVKYVRKFKGAHAGQVRVERESVILVEPKKS